MSVLNQKTIKKSIKFEGIGLHSGKKVVMTLLPAQPNTGIIFKRADLKNNNIIYSSVFNVSNASYCTKLTNENGVTVSTVEHLMAALYGLGVDNLLVELNSEELPIMDGSAKNFVEEIKNTGFIISDQPIRIIKINRKISYKDGEKFITFEPNKISLEIDFEIKYKQNSILNQRNIKNIYIDELREIYNNWASLGSANLPAPAIGTGFRSSSEASSFSTDVLVTNDIPGNYIQGKTGTMAVIRCVRR